ncbi:DUF72 domain-containing protein [Paenibacillus sp. GCM10027626]|uniref:DUF72 domain-containing protein n=1 Tax=Paenibacillus sp. GCM10027626 TaxID=3273411 RepID=UPI003625C975
MIEIGLTGWGDHDELYAPGVKAGDKLGIYAKHYPVVEIDATFYAIHAADTCRKWAENTPPGFSFVVKAYKGLTGHERKPQRQTAAAEQAENKQLASLMEAFIESIQSLREAGKLKAVLFQYPPWFDCTRLNVETLRATKQLLGQLPAALEFRHSSWFSEAYAARTLSFMRSEGWIHSVCDEPQVEPHSVPAVLQATDERLTIVRMHGRNVEGWSKKGNADWREVRYLYRYSREELLEWKNWLAELQRQSTEICVLFNNNSGGDAASNAKMLMELLGMPTVPMAPKQIELF